MIYISGPITGDPDYKTKFANATEVLQAAGHQVINPAAQGDHPGWEWRDYMRRDLIIILTRATGIALLPNWADSKGADLEVQIAKAFGIPVKTIPNWVNTPVATSATLPGETAEPIEFDFPEDHQSSNAAPPLPEYLTHNERAIPEDPAVAALREKFLNPSGKPTTAPEPDLEELTVVNLEEDDTPWLVTDEKIDRWEAEEQPRHVHKGDLLGIVKPGHKCRWLYSPETSQYDCEDCGQSTNDPDKETA